MAVFGHIRRLAEQAAAHAALRLAVDLVTSLITDNDGDAREEDHATHGSDKSKLTLDFLTPHGTLLVIVVSRGRNDPRGFRVHDYDDDNESNAMASFLGATWYTSMSI